MGLYAIAALLLGCGGSSPQSNDGRLGQSPSGSVDGFVELDGSIAPAGTDAGVAAVDAAQTLDAAMTPTSSTATFNFTLEITSAGAKHTTFTGPTDGKVDAYFVLYVTQPIYSLIASKLLPTGQPGDKVEGTLTISTQSVAVTLAATTTVTILPSVIADLEAAITMEVDSKKAAGLFSTTGLIVLTQARIDELYAIGCETAAVYIGYAYATTRGTHRALLLGVALPFVGRMDYDGPI